jgi:hypothetical protein
MIYPVNIIARTDTKRLFKVVAANRGELYSAITEVMVSAGWTDIGELTFETAGQPVDGDPADVDLTNRKIRLKWEFSGTNNLLARVIHSGGGFEQIVNVLLICKDQYTILADPYSVHICYTGTGSRFLSSLSCSNIHVNSKQREFMGLKCSCYLSTNDLMGTGGADDFLQTSFMAGSSDYLGNYQYQHHGFGSVRFVGPRTALRATPLAPALLFGNEVADRIISPVIVSWGSHGGNQFLRGFLWNMVYFVGNLTTGETITTKDGKSYYILFNHNGCSIAWAF